MQGHGTAYTCIRSTLASSLGCVIAMLNETPTETETEKLVDSGYPQLRLPDPMPWFGIAYDVQRVETKVMRI